jgi:hypothetical protein
LVPKKVKEEGETNKQKSGKENKGKHIKWQK